MSINRRVLSKSPLTPNISSMDDAAGFTSLRESLLAGLFLLLILLLFFNQSLSNRRILSGADMIFSTPFFAETRPATYSLPSNGLLYDQVYQFTPWRYFAWNSLRHGHLPLWNPYSSSGTPFVATMQSAVFYPINLLLTLVPFQYTMILSAILRLWIAGICTFLLARRYGLGSFSSFVSSISFMLCGYLVVWLGHPQTNAAVWLPAIILLAESMIHAQRSRKLLFLIALLALIVGVQITGGHIETSVDILFTMGLYYLIRWIQVVRSLELPLAVKLQHLLIPPGIAVFLGIAIAAVQLAPFLEWLPTSAELQNRGGIFFSFQLLDSGFWRQLLILPLIIFPNLYNNPTWNDYPYWSFYPWGINYNEHILYVGTLTFILSIIAMITYWKGNFLVQAWMIIGLITFGRAFHLPLFHLLNQIPLLNLGHSDRLRLILSFSLCILAGYGAQALWNRHFSRQRMAEKLWVRGSLAVITGGLVILAASNILLPILQDRIAEMGRARVDTELANRTAPPQNPIEYYYEEVNRMVSGLLAAYRFDNAEMYLPILWAAGGLIALLWVRKKNMLETQMFQITLLLLVSLDMISFGHDFNPAMPIQNLYPDASVVIPLENDPSIFRITALRQDLIPDAHMMFGLQDIRGHDFPTSWYNRYMNLIPDRIPWLDYGIIFSGVDSPLMSQMNIKYVIAGKPDMLVNNPNIKLLGQYGDVFLGELLKVIPRAYMVYDAVAAQNDDEAAQLLSENPGAMLVRVVLSDAGTIQSSATDQGISPSSLVEPVQYAEDTSSWKVSTSKDGYLVLSDAYYPGWKVFLDEKPTTLYRANLAFRAVEVPQGDHIVTFRYEPASFRLGGLISILSLGIVMFILILTYKSVFNLKAGSWVKSIPSPESNFKL